MGSARVQKGENKDVSLFHAWHWSCIGTQPAIPLRLQQHYALNYAQNRHINTCIICIIPNVNGNGYTDSRSSDVNITTNADAYPSAITISYTNAKQHNWAGSTYL